MRRTRFAFRFTILTLILASLASAPATPDSSRAGAASRSSGFPHLPDSLPPSVEVREGIFYYGGNRMAGNLVLTASDSGLVINGLRVHWVRKPRGYLFLPTNGDLIRGEMYEQARSIAESARKRSLPRDETLRLVRDHFRSYRFVASAEIRGNWIDLRYRDTKINDSWEISDPIDPERMRISHKWSAQHRLDIIKDHLDGGGLVVDNTYLPANAAARMDEAIQRLQTGRATSSDKKLLQQSFPNRLDDLKRRLSIRPMTTRLYPGGPASQSVVVDDGVLYIGGHRQSGPLLLSASESGPVVNGLRNVPPASPFTHVPLSHGDSVRTSLNERARRVAENGRERGLPKSEILDQVRSIFFSEGMVTSIEIRGHWVVVGYVDLPREAWLELDALREPVTQQPGQDWARLYDLLRIKGHLEGGGAVLYTRRGIEYLSSQKSPEIDRLIQRFQAGDISPDDERTLRMSVQHQSFEELRNPIPLEEMRCP